MTHLREKTSLWNELTDEQSEKLVGGVGAGGEPGAGANGWGAGGQPSEGGGLCGTGMFGLSDPIVHGAVTVIHGVKGGDPPDGCPD